MEEKTVGKKLKEELCLNPQNMGDVLPQEEIEKAMEFCEGYKAFLNAGKTEREASAYLVGILKEHGYEPFDYTKKYEAGAKVYYHNRNKALIMAVMGTQSIEDGVNIIASHIDSPRLDLKPRPLYEEAQFGMFKTHYYGGIKKYQWTAIPLSLHGVVMTKDGKRVEVSIGEEEGDPVFCVTDLLPHLAADQMKRSLQEGIKGEELNVLVGSLPFKDDEVSERVKLNLIRLLNEKYGMTEADFMTAELEMVPSFPAKDLGLDRSMVGAYGQDDRVCAYTSFMASLECETPKRTLVTVFADKEEIGSDGNTGLNSSFLRYFIADLAKPYGVEGRTVLSHSTCLSADVNAGFDPTFPEVSEKNNTAYLNYGVVVSKYTGARGKSGTSDASAEFMGEVSRILNEDNVIWQIGELGRVDQGGGGTVAQYVANLNVDVVDVGVPVLSMHAPFEVTAKLDVYMTYRAFAAYAKSDR